MESCGGVVTELGWTETPGGFDAGAYRVRSLGDDEAGGWRLEIERRGLGWTLEPEVTEHRTLRAAMASAARHETERVRRVRLQWHIGGACLAALLCVGYVASGDSGFVGFLIWMGLFAATLRFGSNAFSVAIDDDGWNGRSSFSLGRWLRVESLVPPRRESAPSAGLSEAKVRVLSPWE